jgi:CBS domain-containing protein
MKTGVKVSDAMSVDPVSTSGDTSVFDASKLMLERRVGSLLVLHDIYLEGILTEKDIVNVIAKGLDPLKTLVSEVMTIQVHSISPNIDLAKAMHEMQKNKVRRLPVVKGETLVGILTMNDILKIQPTLFELVIAKSFTGSMNSNKEKYLEGVCESCDNFAQLHDRDGQFICAECMEEGGEEPHEDDQ